MTQPDPQHSEIAATAGYDRHYARMGNSDISWDDAERNAAAFACRKSWLPETKTARVLDFGCGWGLHLLTLWCAGYRNIEGVDQSPEQVAVAQRRAKDRVSVYCGDGVEFLTARRGVYDLITILDVIEHIPVTAQHAVLSAIWNALKPGGRVVIRTPNMACVLAPYSRYMDITHVAGFTEWSLIQILDQTGFVDHRFMPEDLGWEPRAWRPWAPWRGLALRALLNIGLHRVLYGLRRQNPRPRQVGFNLEVFATKPASACEQVS